MSIKDKLIQALLSKYEADYNKLTIEHSKSFKQKMD